MQGRVLPGGHCESTKGPWWQQSAMSCKAHSDFLLAFVVCSTLSHSTPQPDLNSISTPSSRCSRCSR